MGEQEALLEFLRRDRETPHSTTGVRGFSQGSGIRSSESTVKLSKHRKNTSTWDVVNPYTVTEVRSSMVTLTRNSSTFKLYRHAEIDESEPEASNPSVTTNSVRRKKASSASYEPSTDADAQPQAQNEQPAVSPQPDTNTQLVTSQEQAVGVQSGTATKCGPCRPPFEDSAKIQEERSVAQESASFKLHFHAFE